MPYITRPFYCDKDHSRATHHVVYGGTRKGLVAYEIELPVIGNITPHICTWIGNRDGIVHLSISCGVIGCGLEWIDPEDHRVGARVIGLKRVALPLKEFQAFHNFKDTGYELQMFKRNA